MRKVYKVIIGVSIWGALMAASFNQGNDLQAPQSAVNHALTVRAPSNSVYNGPTSTPTLVDTINLSGVNPTGYCWGITYDWDRDGLWITQWNSSYPYMYLIAKTSPLTKLDSVQLGSGVPTYRLGIGYGGNNTVYMAGFDGQIYQIDLTTGTGTVYRATSWSSNEGLGFNPVDDAVYSSDWSANECGWAQPSQSGSWTTWAVSPYPSGMTGAFSGSIAPSWLFMAEEASPGHFYQYQLTGGVPNTTPVDVWDYDPGMTQTLTADAAFDGQYIYVLDQSGPDKVWVYDIGLPPPGLNVLFVDDDEGATYESFFFQTFANLGVSYDTFTVTPGGAGPDSAAMSNYQIVVWNTGDDWTNALLGQDTLEIKKYLNAGGKLWLSGQDVLWALGTTCSWMHISSYVDDNGCSQATGVGPIMSGLSFPTTAGTFTDYADQINPDGMSWSEMYSDLGDTNTIAIDTSAGVPYFLFFNTFAFENINNQSDRDEFARRILAWMGYPFPNHDAATMAILAPSDKVLPGATVDPQARYRNAGGFTDTIDVHFEIDSAGVNVYSDFTTIVLDPGIDTVITFGTWNVGGTEGTVYDVRAYTVLAGDGNPSNDTLTMQTTVSSSYWEIISDAPLPVGSSGHSLASVDDGYYYAFGLHPSGVYSPDVYYYDIANRTWNGPITNPYGGASYATANGVRGVFYRMGGTNSWPTPQSRVDIYDPVGGTWSAGASAPTGLLDHITGVYMDSLIFTFGNGNWSMTPTNAVYIYDVVNDAWTTGTSFPGQGRGTMAGGIVDSFAIIACGYKADGTFGDDYVVGTISSADPTQISWGTWQTIPGIDAPKYRVPSGVDKWNKELFVVGGQISGGTSVQTISYNPYTATWTQWDPKPTGMGNCTPVAITTIPSTGEVGVFVAGGYAGSYLTDHELLHTGRINVAEKNKLPGRVTFGFAKNLKSILRGNDGYIPISYSTTIPGKVSLKVYNHTGRLVRTLVNRPMEPAGKKTVYWDGKDQRGSVVSSGTYFFRLEAQGKVDVFKATLIR